MEIRIKKGTNQTMQEIVNLKHKGCWAERNVDIKKRNGHPHGHNKQIKVHSTANATRKSQANVKR